MKNRFLALRCSIWRAEVQYAEPTEPSVAFVLRL